MRNPKILTACLLIVAVTGPIACDESPDGENNAFSWLPEVSDAAKPLVADRKWTAPGVAGDSLMHQLADRREGVLERSTLPNRNPSTNGEVTFDIPLIHWAGRGLAVDFTLRYNSAWTTPASDFGSKWTHSYQGMVFVERDSYGLVERAVIYSGPDNRVVYERSASSIYILEAQDGSFFKLYESVGWPQPAQTLFVRDPHGNQFTYSKPFSNREVYYLHTLSDPSGNTVTIDYDTEGRIDEITGPLGKKLTFNYPSSSTLASSIVGPDNRQIDFFYSGNQLSVVDFGELEMWDWMKPNILAAQASESVIDQRVSTIFAYHPSGQLWKTMETTGGVTPFKTSTFTYFQSGANKDRVETVTDAVDHVTTYSYENTRTYSGTLGLGGFNLDDHNLSQTITTTQRAGEPDEEIHSSASGLVVEKTTKEMGGTAKISTKYRYDLNAQGLALPNKDGLLTRVDYPEGNQKFQIWDRDLDDRFADGNLIEEKLVAGPRGDGKGGTLAPLINRYTYEPLFNQVFRITGPRGNDPSYVAPINQHAAAVAPNSERYVWTTFYNYMEADSDLIQAKAAEWNIPNAKFTLEQLGDLNGDGRTDQLSDKAVLEFTPTLTVYNATLDQCPACTTQQSGLARIAQHNDFGQILSTAGQTYEYYPDGPGAYLKKITGPSGVTEFEYDVMGRMTKKTDGRGIATTMGYTTDGLLDQLTERAGVALPPRGETHLAAEQPVLTEYYYDRDRNLVRYERTERRFNDAGIEEIFRIPSITEYDLIHRTTAQIEQKSLDAGTQGIVEQRWDFEYNGLKLRRQFNPVVFQPTSPGDGHNVVTFDYDNFGRLEHRTMAWNTANARQDTLQYDGSGNIVESFDGTERIRYHFDGFDRTAKVEYGVGTPEELEERLFYDPASQVVKRQRYGIIGMGQTTHLLYEEGAEFDELGDLIARSIAKFTPPLLPTPSDFHTTYFFTDPLALSKVARNPLGGTTTAAFNAEGGPSSITDDTTGSQRSYVYDANQNVILERLVDTPSGGGTALAEIKAHRYNALDQRVQTVNQAGRSTQFDRRYDGIALRMADANGPEQLTPSPQWLPSATQWAPGARPSQINSLGNVTEAHYNDAGELIGQTSYITDDGHGDGTWNPSTVAVKQSFAYDANGRIISSTDGRQNTTSFEYNGAGELETITRPDFQTKTLLYSPGGDLQHIIYEDNTVVAYLYNSKHQIWASITSNVRGLLDIIKASLLDAMGRPYWSGEALAGYPDFHSVVARSYDSQGNVVHEHTVTAAPGKVIQGGHSSNFDAMGHPTRLDHTATSDHFDWIDYVWDASDRLTEVRQDNSSFVDYEYEGGRENVRNVLTWSGTRLSRNVLSRDGELRASDVQYLKNGSAMSLSCEYDYDRTGHLSSETRIAPYDYEDQLEYDSLYRLVGVDYNRFQGTSAPDQFFEFQYDHAGNRTQRYNGTANVTDDHELDPELDIVDQIYLSGAATGTLDFSWDNRERLLGRDGGTDGILYDARGRIWAMDFPNGSTLQFFYDAYDRVRVQRRLDAAGVLTEVRGFWYDGTTPIHERIWDKTLPASNPTKRSYVYAKGELVEVLQTDPNLVQTQLYPVTSSGRIKMLLDRNGTIMEHIHYPDGFGSPVFLDPADLSPSASNPTPNATSRYDFDQLEAGRRWLGFGELEQGQSTGVYATPDNRFYDPALGRSLKKE